jgi:hypothetical protein
MGLGLGAEGSKLTLYGCLYDARDLFSGAPV